MPKLTLSFKGKLISIYHLPPGETRIGRDPTCGIHIDSLAIEPQHALVHVQDESAVIRTIEPAEPLLLGNQRVTEHACRDGDMLQIGKHTLTFAHEAGVSFVQAGQTTSESNNIASSARPAGNGWLQVFSGEQLGRTFPIENNMQRIGTPGTCSAVIANRSDGYYLSHLEGDEPVVLNNEDIGDRSRKLFSGDRIELGDLRLQFFIEATATAPEPAPSYRHFQRIPFDARVQVKAAGADFLGHLIDISLRGALITRPADWNGRLGDALRLDMFLEDSTSVIHMDVSVAHIEADRIGCVCTHIDVDSISLLRRLVELNLGDSRLLDRELAALVSDSIR